MINKLILSVGLMLFLATGLHAQFNLPALKYSTSALEPYIDSETMNIHYNKHHKAYVTNLNKAWAEIKAKPANLLAAFKQMTKYTDAVRNNGGGHYNHSLFWSIMTPNGNNEISAELLTAINHEFKSLDDVKKKISEAGLTRFGSGWAWLVLTPSKKLIVTSTPNQDNPLMSTNKIKGIPILGIDVWEHAYYLKYQNKRGDYLAAIWNVIDWKEVSKLYNDALQGKAFEVN